MADVTERAVSRYHTGWVAAGAPPGHPRAVAGAVAAVELTHTHPELVEATLHLGHLDGVWQKIFDRRDAQRERLLRSFKKAWRAGARLLPIDTAVRALHDSYRHVGEAADPIATVSATATAQQLLARLPDEETWADIRAILLEALREATAEGQVDQLALAADQAGKLGFDFGLAFDDAIAALQDADLGDVDSWLARVLHGAGRDLARVLAGQLDSGASYPEMVSAATDLLTGADLPAVSTVIDWAQGWALTQGALAVYGAEGVTEVTFLTAGDDRVCPTCEEAEVGSPYSLTDLPAPPLHPFCRCATQAVDLLADVLWQSYIPDE